jgi:class 3 adenylate cyclase
MPAADTLPAGVVTFLLTDIEGSTQAWQAAPSTMTGLVSRHYEILDDGIAVHGGKRPQEQGEGDSVVAVFVDPRDALAAAVETQLALRRQLPDLPVRMALHTGEAMLRNEANYVGLTIIRGES